MPGKARVSGDEAMLFLGNIRDRLTLIALSDAEYFKALETSAGIGLAGGGIYDALLGHCALKAQAETIYTWNVKHFKRLGPDIAARVTNP